MKTNKTRFEQIAILGPATFYSRILFQEASNRSPLDESAGLLEKEKGVTNLFEADCLQIELLQNRKKLGNAAGKEDHADHFADLIHRRAVLHGELRVDIHGGGSARGHADSHNHQLLVFAGQHAVSLVVFIAVKEHLCKEYREKYALLHQDKGESAKAESKQP